MSTIRDKQIEKDVKEAKAELLKDGFITTFYGEVLDLDNDQEVIAALYAVIRQERFNKKYSEVLERGNALIEKLIKRKGAVDE